MLFVSFVSGPVCHKFCLEEGSFYRYLIRRLFENRRTRCTQPFAAIAILERPYGYCILLSRQIADTAISNGKNRRWSEVGYCTMNQQPILAP